MYKCFLKFCFGFETERYDVSRWFVSGFFISASCDLSFNVWPNVEISSIQSVLISQRSIGIIAGERKDCYWIAVVVAFFHCSLDIESLWTCSYIMKILKFVRFMQAVIYDASASVNDFVGCCLWCLVSGTSDVKTRRDCYWICWEVNAHYRPFKKVHQFVYFVQTLCVSFYRVRGMISHRAGLKKVPWDGYLKYSRPSPRLTQSKYVFFVVVNYDISFSSILFHVLVTITIRKV